LSGQLIGVSNEKTFSLFTELIPRLSDGLDEFSNTSNNNVIFIRNREISTKNLNAENYGLSKAHLDDLIIKSKKESIIETLKIIYGISTKEKTDVVLFNAAAALLLSNKIDNLHDGVKLARKAVFTGLARNKLKALIEDFGDPKELAKYEKEILE
jgi:anthranilate phosphoribosyltransferase